MMKRISLATLLVAFFIIGASSATVDTVSVFSEKMNANIKSRYKTGLLFR